MTEQTLSPPLARNYFSSMLSLCKVEISLFAALSAVAGLCAVAPLSATVLALVTGGVFLIACGAGALNHYQERNADALMPRTAGRPLPSGRIRPPVALTISFSLIGSGAAVLCLAENPTPALLGLAAVFWYNGFYTRFKAKSPLAAIPGALVGAIPPVIGWAAGGGYLLDFRLAALCFFFFVWQVLHFMIHILAFAGEYENAGLPSLSRVFNERQLKRLAFQWLLAVATSTLLLGLADLIHSALSLTAIATASFWLILKGIVFVRDRQSHYAILFKEINYYVLIIMTLLALDGYFHFS